MRQAFFILGSFCLLVFSGSLAAQDATSQPAVNDSATPTSSSSLNLDDLRTFTDVFNQVRRNYVEEVDDKQLMEAAITGMLSSWAPDLSISSLTMASTLRKTRRPSGSQV